MRPMRWTTCLVIAGLLIGCDDAVTDPQTADEATLKVDRSASAETVIDDPYVGFVACANDGAGEFMEWWGSLTFNRTTMETPGGNTQRHNRYDFSGLPLTHPQYMGPQYVLVGLTSGDTWYVDSKKTRVHERRVDLKDGSWYWHQTMNIFLDGENGERLHVLGTYQLKRVDGEWTMFHINRGACPVVW